MSEKKIKITCDGTDYVDYKTLVPLQGDLKTLSDENLGKLKNSIIKYGVTVPKFVWKSGKKMYICDGHQTVKALDGLFTDGYEIPDIPIVYIKAKNKQEAKEKLLHITSTYGEFTTEGFADFISDMNFDVDLGPDLFDNVRLTNDEFELPISEAPPEETVGDDEFEDKVKAVTKLGDLWELGNHRLLCGNSTIDINITTVLKGAIPHVHVIDPPYEKEELYDRIPSANRAKLLVFWDFKRFATPSFVAKSKGWTAQYEFIWDNLTSWYTPNRPLARHKACGVFSIDPMFAFDKAIIKDGKQREAKVVHNTRGASNYKPLDGAVHLSTIFVTNKAGMNTGGHAHGKPIAWIEAIFNGIGGSIYLDYFAGSGSSIIACEKTDKLCYAIELDPSNCDVIVNRYKNWCINNKKTCLISLNGVKYNKG